MAEGARYYNPWWKDELDAKLVTKYLAVGLKISIEGH
jgi:hypothetical protein